MAWTPSSTDLGSVNENVSISHTVTYIDDATMTSYPVTIAATETNPTTISISGTPEGTFPVVTKFNQIDLNKLEEMISYKASVSTSRVFTYTATAKDGATTVATQSYTKTVTNDWTSGKTSLQTYVGYTL
jgi:hypothetical protein